MARAGVRRPGYDGNELPAIWPQLHLRPRRPLISSLAGAVLFLRPRRLALGPQLAAFAAAQNIQTSLVIGPQQDAATTATLRTACTAPSAQASIRHGLLRVAPRDEG